MREPRLDRGSPAVSFETGKCEPSNFVFTFKIELPNLDPLHFHIGLAYLFLQKKKKQLEFDRDFTEFVDEFSFASLTILGLPVPMNVFYLGAFNFLQQCSVSSAHVLQFFG